MGFLLQEGNGWTAGIKQMMVVVLVEIRHHLETGSLQMVLLAPQERTALKPKKGVIIYMCL